MCECFGLGVGLAGLAGMAGGDSAIAGDDDVEFSQRL